MRQFAIALALLPALAVAPGCKKKAPESATHDLGEVEVKLQVTSISPAAVAPKTSTTATVYGSAFEQGATVTFTGPMELRGSEVQVDSANALELTIPGLVEGTYDVTVANPDGTSSVLRSGLTVREMELACRSVVVNFDLDQSSLRKEAKSILDANLTCLQQAARGIRVEGHCDERGTVDYNLALGQRRADTVRQYLVNGGIGSSRIQTTTYGEERPVDTGHNEAAWAKNRRAEILASE